MFGQNVRRERLRKGLTQEQLAERDISADSKLFLTERNDQTNRVKCFNLRAAAIRENLESGKEIDVEGLCARVTARHTS